MNLYPMLKELVYDRRPLYNKKFPLILFCTPKSGSTTLFKWFFFQTGVLDEAIKHHPWIHHYKEDVYDHQIKKQEIIFRILESNKKVYKLVRNPYKRTVSSFLHLVSNSSHYREWAEIGKLFNHKDDAGVSFKEFLYYIEKVGPCLGAIDPHFAQQYFPGEEYFMEKYIYLENFTDTIRKIEKKYNLRRSPLSSFENSWHHHSSSMTLAGNYAETPFTVETLSREGVPTYKSFYDEETLSLVKEIFKKDIELYGYKMESDKND